MECDPSGPDIMKVAKKYYFRDVVTCIGFFAGVGAVLASVGVLLVFWCNNVYFWVVCCALLCGTVVCRKFVRRARYQHRVKQGVDYCIKQECLDAVPFVLKHYAKRQTWTNMYSPQARFNVAPRFDCFAATYSHLRFRGLLFSRRLFRELEFLDGNDNAYRAICREDNESYYCVRMQANDERVYRLELEVSKDPYPYASDIEHYIALRIGNMGVDASNMMR